MADTTFSVSGMTCEHCSKAVRAELGELEGVREVSIELVPGAPPLCGWRVSRCPSRERSPRPSPRPGTTPSPSEPASSQEHTPMTHP